jgi:hypothetical protein
MVRNIATSAAAVSFAALLGGCQADTVTGTDPVPDLAVSGSAQAAVSASAAGGASVFRFKNISFILVYDAERELLAAQMPSNICGDGEFNVVNVQRVETPSRIGQVVVLTKSDAEQVAVYRAASPADAGLASSIDFFGFFDIVNFGTFCNFLSGPELVAEGIVRRVSTFSRVSFHAQWTGTIAGTDGQAYRLTEVYQLNADPKDPNNPAGFSQKQASIQLTPIH